MESRDAHSPREFMRGLLFINRIDQAIYESEKEMAEGGIAIELNEALEKLNRKYFREKTEQ